MYMLSMPSILFFNFTSALRTNIASRFAKNVALAIGWLRSPATRKRLRAGKSWITEKDEDVEEAEEAGEEEREEAEEKEDEEDDVLEEERTGVCPRSAIR